MAARTSISTVGDDFGKFSNLGDQFFDIPNRGRGQMNRHLMVLLQM